MDLTEASDRDISDSVGAFKAALAARQQTLIDPRVRRILWVLDGSNQDDAAAELVMTMARRLEAPITALHAGTGPERDDALERQTAALAGTGLDVTADATDADGAAPFEQILDRQRRLGCDLVIVNAPHDEDFDVIGDGSVGTNLDMLMGRCEAPLLVVREPRAQLVECLGEMIVPLTIEDSTVLVAASWALRTIGGDGNLRLLAVVDREHAEASVEALETDTDIADLGEEMLAGLRRPVMAGLIGAVQRRSSELGIECRVSVRAGDPVEVTAAMAHELDAMIVTGCPRRPLDAGYRRVQALARASRHPLLIV